MLPMSVEERGGDESLNLFERLQSNLGSSDEDESSSYINGTSKTTVKVAKSLATNNNAKETCDESSSLSHARNISNGGTLAVEETALVNNSYQNQSHGEKPETAQTSTKSAANEKSTTETSNFLSMIIKTELMDYNEYDNYPTTSNAVEYNYSRPMSNDSPSASTEPFNLTSISKKQARSFVETLQTNYQPPVRRRRRRVKKQPQEEIISSEKSSNRRQSNKYPDKSEILDDDIFNLDDVLKTWEAKMELQVACGFNASENLPVESVAVEFQALRRIECLSLQYNMVKNAAGQLLKQQKSLICKLAYPKEFQKKVRSRITPSVLPTNSNVTLYNRQSYSNHHV